MKKIIISSILLLSLAFVPNTAKASIFSDTFSALFGGGTSDFPSLTNLRIYSTLTNEEDSAITKDDSYVAVWNEKNTKDTIHIYLFKLVGNEWVRQYELASTSPVGNGLNKLAFTVIKYYISSPNSRYQIHVETKGTMALKDISLLEAKPINLPNITISNIHTNISYPDGFKTGNTMLQGILFNFTVTAGDNTLYINKNPARALATSTSSDGKFTLTEVYANPKIISSDTNDAYAIPAGSSRVFTYYGAISLKEDLINRIYKVTSFNYGLSSNNTGQARYTFPDGSINFTGYPLGGAATSSTATSTSSIIIRTPKAGETVNSGTSFDVRYSVNYDTDTLKVSLYNTATGLVYTSPVFKGRTNDLINYVSIATGAILEKKLPSGKYYVKICDETKNICAQSDQFYIASANVITNSPPLVEVLNQSAQLGDSLTSMNTTVSLGVIFSFTLKAGDNTVYLSANPNIALATSSTGFISQSEARLPISGVVASPAILAGDYLTSQSRGYYVIPAGTSRKFTFVGTLDATKSPIGLKTFRIYGINYDQNPSVLTANKITVGLDALKVSATFGSNQPTVPSTTIISPNGGETYRIGNTYQINWKNAGYSTSEKVAILLVNSDDLIVKEIARYENNDGNYAWTVSSKITPGKYKIDVMCELSAVCITDRDARYEDTSDNTFTIIPADTTLPPVTNTPSTTSTVPMPYYSSTPTNSPSPTYSPSPTVSVSPISVSCSASTNNSGTPTAMWSANVSGGRTPYQYSWSVYNDVSNYIGSTQSSSFSATYSSAGTKQAVIRITDASGQTASASCSGVIPTYSPTQATSPSPTASATPSPSVSQTPTISSISPSSGSTGQLITIYGSNFTSSDNTVYVKTQNTTTTIRPSAQSVSYVQFTLPVFVKGASSFAVENGNLEISTYLPFTAIEASPSPVSRVNGSNIIASVLYSIGDFFDYLAR